MALEDAIKENTAAIIALTEAVKKGGGTGGAAAKPAAGAKDKPAASKDKPAKPKHSAEQVKAKILEVKNTISQEKAAEVIAEAGGPKLADLLADPTQYDKAYELAEAALAEESGDEGEGEGEDDL